MKKHKSRYLLLLRLQAGLRIFSHRNTLETQNTLGVWQPDHLLAHTQRVVGRVKGSTYYTVSNMGVVDEGVRPQARHFETGARWLKSAPQFVPKARLWPTEGSYDHQSTCIRSVCLGRSRVGRAVTPPIPPSGVEPQKRRKKHMGGSEAVGRTSPPTNKTPPPSLHPSQVII